MKFFQNIHAIRDSVGAIWSYLGAFSGRQLVDKQDFLISKLYKSLIFLVAGEGFEPSTFGMLTIYTVYISV